MWNRTSNEWVARPAKPPEPRRALAAAPDRGEDGRMIAARSIFPVVGSLIRTVAA